MTMWRQVPAVRMPDAVCVCFCFMAILELGKAMRLGNLPSLQGTCVCVGGWGVTGLLVSESVSLVTILHG